MNEKIFSQEFLNAFVDDQLTPEEKSRAYEEINRDESLNRQVCELRKVRDLVQLAYRDVPGTPSTSTPHRRLRLGNVAAGLMLALGVAIGWSLHTPTDNDTAESASLEFAPAETTRRVAAAPTPVAGGTALAPRPAPARAIEMAKTGDPVKVLIHLNDGDVAHLAQALDEVEGLVRHYRENRVNGRIEVVMNGPGLNLVRADVTQFRDRIVRIQREHDNVLFAACKNTIDRLKREEGIVAKLLPGVVVIDSGVAQLMRRQHQGWAYIQV
jgi:intracellular sulfur oxidation DsrE/DsrF family protein